MAGRANRLGATCPNPGQRSPQASLRLPRLIPAIVARQTLGAITVWTTKASTDRQNLVEVAGFEPTTSCSQSRKNGNQANNRETRALP